MSAVEGTGEGAGAYGRAGVDVGAAARAVELIGRIAAGATRPEVREGVGGFAGLCSLGDGRLLAASTDGVGTKLEVARAMGVLDTVGIDLVAMSANDVACAGADPLFFLDYLAVGRLVPEEVAAIVEGVAEGCRRAGCALLGGETAEHPGVLEPGRFDLAGTCVGMVDEADVLGPERVREGDVLVGLRSSGLHSNGFSLVRKVLAAERPADLRRVVPELGRPLGEELLEPTLIYTGALAALRREGLVHAAAHITGGGFLENVPRALPEGLGARIDTAAWRPPPIFDVVGRAAGLPPREMFGVLNMGIGMVVAVPAGRAEAAIAAVSGAGSDALPIGEVVRGEGVLLI